MLDCVVCHRDDLETYRLLKCPVCFKMVCDDCATKLYGKYFCCNTCAQTFFFVDDDDIE